MVQTMNAQMPILFLGCS